MRSSNQFIILVLLLTTLSTLSLAQNLKSWNSVDGLFSDGSKWVPAGVPSSINNVLISTGSCVADSAVSIGNFTANSDTQVTFQSTSTFNGGTVSIALDSVVTFQDAVSTTSITNSGTLQISGTKSFSISGQTNNLNLAKIDSASVTFSGLFQTYYVLNITGDSTYLTKFGSIFFSPEGVINIEKTNVTFDSSTILSASKFNTEQSTLIHSGQVITNETRFNHIGSEITYTNTIAFENQTSITSENSNHRFTGITSFYNQTSVMSTNDIFTFLTTKVYVHGNANLVGKEKTNFLFGESYVYFLNTSYIDVADNSFVYVRNGYLLLRDSAYFNLDNSTIWLDGSAFVLEGESKITTTSISDLYIIGNLSCTVDSQITMDKSQLLINGGLYLRDSSTATLTNGYVPSFVNGIVGLFENSKLDLTKTQLSIFGSMYLEANSNFKFSDSELNIFDKGSIFSTNLASISILNAQVFIYGSLFAPKIDISHSNILVVGELSISNDAVFETIDLNVLGNLNVKSSSFIANDCNIRVEKNIRFSSSKFLTSNTNITIVNGELYIQRGGVIQMNNTNFYNNLGLLDTGADIQILGGSNTFINQGSILLSSNIVKSDDATSDVVLHNFGNFSVSLDKSRINIPISNSGSFKILSNTVNVNSYTQSDGTFAIQGGTINSNSTIVINGGVIQGRGTINQSLINNGALGSRDGVVHSFKINGDYQQTAPVIINVLSLEDFTNVKVQNIATINSSSVEIRISNQLLSKLVGQENGTQVDLITFGEGSQFNVESIKFSTFDPETPTEDKQTTDKCVAQAQSTGRSFSVLLKGCPPKEPLLSAGAIAGIVVGGAVAVIAGSILIHNRKSIAMAFKIKKESVKMKKKPAPKKKKPSSSNKPKNGKKPKEPTPFETPTPV